tara:strand:+ start:49 stop:933 length:885 start_codon:yes stop_codon:yes gene_type:complete
MINRKEFAEEIILRENVRKAIQIIMNQRGSRLLKEQKQEKELRSLIRGLISEAKKIAVYDSTGKNELNVFLLNSPFLSTVETSYRKLTTSAEQRESYIEHIIVFVNEFLQRLDSLEEDEFDRDEKPEEPEEVEDKIKIDIGAEEEVEDKETLTLGPDDIKFADFILHGRDLTGAKNAYTDFSNSKTVLRDAYSNLDNAEDKVDFRDELPRQIILYGRQYENSLKPELGASEVEDLNVDVGPGEPEAMTATGGAPVPEDPLAVEPETPPEEEAANLELQELLSHLDIDDIIENLL